jgi:hypothetical protein
MRPHRGVVVAGIFVAALAVAEEPPRDCEGRAAWIQARLEREARRVTAWRWGWGVTAVAGAGGQLAAAALVSDRDARIDLAVGGASTLGLGVGVLLPPEIDVRDAPGACPARLADAERRLAEAGRSERASRSPWLHAGNVAFNAGVGLLLGLAWHHWASGAINFAAGTVVGELQLFTVPDGAALTIPF